MASGCRGAISKASRRGFSYKCRTYAPGALSANDSGFMPVASLVSDANAALPDNSLTVAGVPARVYQGLLKTALDRANNNLTFVQNQPCEYTFAQ